MEFVTEGMVTIIRPARGTPNPFEEYAGALQTFPNGRDEINAWVRDVREESLLPSGNGG